MGHRGSKIGFSGINRDGFFMKITFPRSVCLKNIFFARFLKIFEKMARVAFSQNRQKIVLNRSKNQNLYCFLFFYTFLAYSDPIIFLLKIPMIGYLTSGVK